MTKTTPLFIVAGLDSDGRPHAARFAPTEQGPAAKAAALMGFRIGEAASGKPLAAARALPAGRIFATGKALVPYVKQELYDQLTGLVPLGIPSPVNEYTDDSRFPMRRPGNDPWAEIKPSDVVLCFESAELGWWEAVVEAIETDGDFILRWRDHPKLKTFRRQRDQVALLGAVKQTVE